jgi:hypothetical protein
MKTIKSWNNVDIILDEMCLVFQQNYKEIYKYNKK